MSGTVLLSAALAQAPAAPSLTVPGPVFIPQLLDPDRRIEAPSTRIAVIRFVTEEDYPPFNYVGRDSALAGLNIDLARAICAELGAQCTIQSRRWDLLLLAVERGEADAVIASHRITPALRKAYEVSMPIHRAPARFVARKDSMAAKDRTATPRDFSGMNAGVVGGSSHEAYLNAFFPALRLTRFSRFEEALEAMRLGRTDLAFGDGVAGAFWMNGSESLACCTFAGGAYTESRFFGEGAGIVMQLGNTALRNAIDFALWRLNRDGRYARLYLKHFPIPFY